MKLPSWQEYIKPKLQLQQEEWSNPQSEVTSKSNLQYGQPPPVDGQPPPVPDQPLDLDAENARVAAEVAINIAIE